MQLYRLVLLSVSLAMCLMLQAPIVCLAQTGDAAAAVGEKWPGPVAVEKQTTGQEQTGESCAQCHQKRKPGFCGQCS